MSIAKTEKEAAKTGARFVDCRRCQATGYYRASTGAPCFACAGKGYRPSKAESDRRYRKSIERSMLEASDNMIRAEAIIAAGAKGFTLRAAQEDLAHAKSYHGRHGSSVERFTGGALMPTVGQRWYRPRRGALQGQTFLVTQEGLFDNTRVMLLRVRPNGSRYKTFVPKMVTCAYVLDALRLDYTPAQGLRDFLIALQLANVDF